MKNLFLLFSGGLGKRRRLWRVKLV